MKKARFINYASEKQFPKIYLDFVRKGKFREKETRRYTRNQWRFAIYILKNKKTFSTIGDMETVFADVRNSFRIIKPTKIYDDIKYPLQVGNFTVHQEYSVCNICNEKIRFGIITAATHKCDKQ